MKPWLPHAFTAVPRVFTLLCLAVTLTGCSGSATPPAPSIVEQLPTDVSLTRSPAPLVATSQTVNTFPLVNGSFTFALTATDGSVGTLKGTYTGEAIVPAHGSKSTVLELQITETSGIGSTITAVAAEGSRAFIDEGDFALSLSLTSSLTKSPLRLMVRGTSHVSCSASHRILLTLHGTDSTRGFLDITADLQHEIERTGC